MRTLRTVLEMMALCGLLLAAVLQFRDVDLNLEEREKQEDLRLRDYVISHDIEYVKGELIDLQKERWKNHQARSNAAKRSFLILSGSILLLVVALIVRSMGVRKAQAAGEARGN